MDINNCILEKFSVAKLTEENLHLEFKCNVKKVLHSTRNAQRISSLAEFPLSRTSPMNVPIRNAQVLVEKSPQFKKVIELDLDFENLENCDIAPGDTIGILSSNCEKDINFIIERLKLEDVADFICKISVKTSNMKKSYKLPTYIPSENVTPRQILRDCLNLRSIPKKQLIRSLAECTVEALEKQFLLSLSSKEGSHLYGDVILSKGLTFLDLLRLCPSCRPSLALIIEQLPRLLPRPYSIANSPLSGKMKIIFSVQNENAAGVTTKMLYKLASQFIENHPHGQSNEVCLYLRKTNNFRYTATELPQDIIMISIGCAIAPFLGFLEHKDILLNKVGRHKEHVGNAWLFTGFTTLSTSIYRDKLLEYKERGILSKLFESYSRDNNSITPHLYVQEQLRANAGEFVEFLQNRDTILYVCADGAKISQSIYDAICDCVTQVLLCEKDEAIDMLNQFKWNGKYREDIWV